MRGIGGWLCIVHESAENQVAREEVETNESGPRVLYDPEPFVLRLESLESWKNRSRSVLDWRKSDSG